MSRNDTSPYQAMTDEALLSAVRQGDLTAEDCLYERYKRYVRMRAHSYFLIGADHEDITQEGMIGLYKAIRDFDDTKANSFKTFAELCVTRQIITAIKRATRQKHIPLNSYISLNMPLYQEDAERTLIDVFRAAYVNSPEDALISRESYTDMATGLNNSLSALERNALSLYLSGRSYVEIAALLNRRPKAIDNALQRVKHKLEKLMEEKSDGQSP